MIEHHQLATQQEQIHNKLFSLRSVSIQSFRISITHWDLRNAHSLGSKAIGQLGTFPRESDNVRWSNYLEVVRKELNFMINPSAVEQSIRIRVDRVMKTM